MEELKPCPFCGGTAMIHSIKYGLDVVCTNERDCVLNNLYHDYDQAATAWNRRDDGWISVEDRLPESRIFVVISDEIGVGTAVWWSDLRRWVTRNMEDVVGVQYWQPLPAPPTK